MKGLAPRTQQVFENISTLDCLRPYTLVGGTALSLQLGTRQSEDLDFMSWRKTKQEKREIDWYGIKQSLDGIGEVQKVDLLGFDHVEFVVDGVKLSFYASDKRSPVETPVPIIGNIVAADIKSIGAMKMEVLLRRSAFRDYYDIYSILLHGVELEELIDLSLRYSEHRLKTKHLISMLTNAEHFTADSNFAQLCPAYNVTAADIEAYIRKILRM